MSMHMNKLQGMKENERELEVWQHPILFILSNLFGGKPSIASQNFKPSSSSPRLSPKGLRLYIGNFPLHMDEVLVKTTKSRRIRMVERKTRKRSVGIPKTKHLEARNTMERPEKKKRSVTLIRDHFKEYLSNLIVEFDHFGRAIGPNRFKFTSYRGVTTRKMISILIDSWDLVDQCDKDQLWLNINNHWHIRDDDHKAQVLRDCNTHWKAYKSELLKLWDNGVNPNIWKDKKPFSSEELEERLKTWMINFGDKVKPFCKAYNESTTKGKERLEVTKGKESFAEIEKFVSVGMVIHVFHNIHGLELAV
ncbi:unnamed protein product [Lactuca saligna]|uniref:Uncharacterized protein n=1 Tax=Lactuca saligna TaxID=75948 RepID=A0AA35W1R8_LACSI|nr:unnamed protein product [Lactuca saligna]